MPPKPFSLDDFDDLDPPQPQGGGLAARALAGGEPPYLKGLNPEQRAAVETLDGPLLVLAGAGTGKTRVLTARLAHILATGRARPSQILAVTFTNKAAREMRHRIGDFIGGAVEGMAWLGTFHSIGAKILRRHAELAGLKSDFTILDTDDQVRLLKQLIAAHDIDEKRWPARVLAQAIDGWKNRGLGPDRVPAGEAHSYAQGKGVTIYAEYQERLKILNATDFGDLLLECIAVFRNYPDVLADYQRRFRYMMVDEYQDTNVAQYLWLRLLAQGTGNICCVGDDDQSIYGWRGAEVDNILRFEKDFPGARIIRLERNYRSTPHILGAASGLIAKNEGRLGKTLRTDLPEGERITLRGHWDGDEEARAVGDDLEALQRQGERLDDVAILVRASFQMRAFEDRFITLGLPYRVVGGPRFYERQEVRDALAYLKVVVSPDNDLAFERIVNLPRRGIGDSSLKRLHDEARRTGVSLFRAGQRLVQTEELPGRTRKALADLIAAFGRWRQTLDGIPHTELAEIVLDESGYTQMWLDDKSPDAPGRLENLKELVRSMGEFETMTGFLDHVSLVMDMEAAGEAEDKVNLMTLHSAKGLEFSTVFLPGWEEGLFPHQRALDENGRAGLEEERRLAYVGITRAKRRAIISFAQNRRVHNLWQNAMPSRFIDELPEGHVDVVPMSTSYGGYGIGGFGASRFDDLKPFANSYATPGWQRARERTAQGQGFARPPHLIEGQLVASEVEGGGFTEGERVFHQKFGYGRITRVDGNKLTVDFEKAGEKRIIDSFVERT